MKLSSARNITDHSSKHYGSTIRINCFDGGRAEYPTIDIWLPFGEALDPDEEPHNQHYLSSFEARITALIVTALNQAALKEES